jgi:hypothetical protein
MAKAVPQAPAPITAIFWLVRIKPHNPAGLVPLLKNGPKLSPKFKIFGPRADKILRPPAIQAALGNYDS